MIKEFCRSIESFCVVLHRDNFFRAQQDLQNLRQLTDKIHEETEVANIGLEALVAIITQNVRKQILRTRMAENMNDARGLCLKRTGTV